MQNKSQMARRAPRGISRSLAASGALRAGTLGELQDCARRPEYYFKRMGKEHQCKWLLGTENAVCCLCGRTVPRRLVETVVEKQCE